MSTMVVERREADFCSTKPPSPFARFSLTVGTFLLRGPQPVNSK
jgi:hypothetical protein